MALDEFRAVPRGDCAYGPGRVGFGGAQFVCRLFAAADRFGCCSIHNGVNDEPPEVLRLSCLPPWAAQPLRQVPDPPSEPPSAVLGQGRDPPGSGCAEGCVCSSNRLTMPPATSFWMAGWLRCRRGPCLDPADPRRATRECVEIPHRAQRRDSGKKLGVRQSCVSASLESVAS
jgi:hypothetical protein